MVKTKIFATTGPASADETTLRKMYKSGLDGVRLNFSHGTHKGHIEVINRVRKLNSKLRRHVKIMQDLEGYRIRVGALKSPVTLNKKDIIYVTQDSVEGTSEEISFDYEGSLRGIKKGMSIFIDDGKIVLDVIAKEKRRLKTSVRFGGVLRPHKGINIPEAKLEFEALTDKDKKDVKIAIKYGLDYIAQSFVRSADDIAALRSLISKKIPSCRIFAKVENREALRNIDAVIEAADGIIVARGDMGICVPIYKVPVIQKEIIKKCLVKHKPVFVATQMLDSMTEENLPTRAEVSDVANAILDGATHLLLSQETAVGKHPAMVVSMMNKIIKHTEKYEDSLNWMLE